jgi:hypothetical protein
MDKRTGCCGHRVKVGNREAPVNPGVGRVPRLRATSPCSSSLAHGGAGTDSQGFTALERIVHELSRRLL